MELAKAQPPGGIAASTPPFELVFERFVAAIVHPCTPGPWDLSLEPDTLADDVVNDDGYRTPGIVVVPKEIPATVAKFGDSRN